MQNKYIFTFWEPENKMPAYIKLCMKTWEKFLPDYEIVNLNFNNLENYLPKDILKKIIYKKIPLPQQADCIRAWLLYLHGGYWFDADTIITNDKIIRELEKYECSMLGNNEDRNDVNIGFIYAKKSSTIIKNWAEEIINRVSNYKKYRRFKLFYQLFNYQEHKTRKHWGYFGNNILDPLIKESTDKELFILNKIKLNTLLENEITKENSSVKKYQKFYFTSIDYKNSLSKNQGVICLHNSWTPKEYKKMSEKEFLNSNTTLSNMLKELLEK